MAKKKKGGAIRVVIGNQTYRLVTLRVEGTYEDRPEVNGFEVPAELLFLDDDDVSEITEGARFVTALLPISVIGEAPGEGEGG
jgi:hypothetical protein